MTVVRRPLWRKMTQELEEVTAVRRPLEENDPGIGRGDSRRKACVEVNNPEMGRVRDSTQKTDLCGVGRRN